MILSPLNGNVKCHPMNRRQSPHERVVRKDNVVQWDGRRLQISPQPRSFSFAGAEVHIHRTPDGRASLYYGETRLEHTNARG